jgi:hypothetical protein
MCNSFACLARQLGFYALIGELPVLDREKVHRAAILSSGRLSL